MHLIFFTFTLFIFLTGCSQERPENLSDVHKIQGRNTENSTNRPYLYRIKKPTSWERRDASADESLIDTKKSIVEFFIHDNEETIRITIHNFPTQTIESRIAPAAQLARWKKQFTKLDQATLSIIPQSFSGYSGLLFEGSGKMNDTETAVLGWSMQLAPEHYRTLSHPEYDPQMRADFTIKAVGSKNLIEKHRGEIYAFARSFELIDEVSAGF